MDEVDCSSLREDYNAHAPLTISDLHPDPLRQFSLWFTQAQRANLLEVNAFVLATNGGAQVSQRTVLLKFFDDNGFVFFTHYESRKAQEMQQNPRVAMLFPWYALQRQVRIEGIVHKVTAAQNARYFFSRPRASQLGAWVSPQSKTISKRSELLAQWQAMKKKFANGKIPLPQFWGGYCVVAQSYEFWQGQPGRLHDRFYYVKNNNNWIINRLAP